MKKAAHMDTFDLKPGRKLGRHYEVEQMLGAGVEGEVYRIRELGTSIRRAAKLYFPHRNPNHRSSTRHAQKLEALRGCSIVLQYHHSELVQIRRQKVVCLISDLCEGVQLEKWLDQQLEGRLETYQALHVLYHLAKGLESVHALGEYHADVHSQNILIRRVGIGFEMKLIDFYDWGKPARYKQQQDVVDTVKVFHECLGGRTYYREQPDPVRYICAGLQGKRIRERFPTMSSLRVYLETFNWD